MKDITIQSPNAKRIYAQHLKDTGNREGLHVLKTVSSGFGKLDLIIVPHEQALYDKLTESKNAI